MMPQIWLCFSGGNALGAYQAGVYEVLDKNRIEPQRIAGASIGAVTGAIIAGNTAERRLPQLRAFWDLAAEEGGRLFGSILGMSERTLKQRSIMRTLMSGRPGLFHPSLKNIWQALPFRHASSSIFETDPQRETFRRFINFDLLNEAHVSFVATAVDIETGEDVVFKGGEMLTVEHIMASTAFPVAFPPVEINGRKMVDPGVSANLPLRAMFEHDVSEEVLCVCIDLFPQRGALSHSLDMTIGRTTDVLFASQSKHALRETRFSLSARGGTPVSIVHMSYGNRAHEAGLKACDYSRHSIDSRWSAGAADAHRLLDIIGHMPPRRDNVDVWRLSTDGGLENWEE
jgi:NTE family protein